MRSSSFATGFLVASSCLAAFSGCVKKAGDSGVKSADADEFSLPKDLGFSEDIEIKDAEVGIFERNEEADAIRIAELAKKYTSFEALKPIPSVDDVKRCKFDATSHEGARGALWRTVQKIDSVANPLGGKTMWVGLFDNRISRLLVNRYMDCVGQPVLLSRKEMIYLFPNLGSQKGGIFPHINFLGALTDAVDAKAPESGFPKEIEVEFKFLDFSSGGNLGNFWNHNKAKVIVRGSSTREATKVRAAGRDFDMSVTGLQSWTDVQDYNNMPSRGREANWRVVFANRYMRGLPYDVRTEELSYAVETRLTNGANVFQEAKGSFEGRSWATKGSVGGYTPYGIQACKILGRSVFVAGDAVASAVVASELQPVAQEDAIQGIASAADAAGPGGAAIAGAGAAVICLLKDD